MLCWVRTLHGLAQSLTHAGKAEDSLDLGWGKSGFFVNCYITACCSVSRRLSFDLSVHIIHMVQISADLYCWIFCSRVADVCATMSLACCGPGSFSYFIRAAWWMYAAVLSSIWQKFKNQCADSYHSQIGQLSLITGVKRWHACNGLARAGRHPEREPEAPEHNTP